LPKLLSRLEPGSLLLADHDYDANRITELAMKQGAWVKITPESNRCDPICFNPHLYRVRTKSSSSSTESALSGL